MLAAAGLALADVATYASLRAFLFGRVDSTLEAGHVQVERLVFGQDGGPAGGDGAAARAEHRGDAGPPAAGIGWYQVRSTGGRVLKGGFLVGSGSPPRIAAAVRIPAHPRERDPERVAYFTVASRNGETSFRVRASIDPQRPGRILLIASPLGDVLGTLHRLVLIEMFATLAVLAAIAGLGLWAVRMGLRPLREIEATAATIAAGDLTQRIERAESDTEVGRLGLSLNAMLAQIETAFRARADSEERLRESEQQLRQFVSDASHELRTPLAAVRAYAELFDRGAAERPRDLARAMAGITREAERMSLLVEDLLLLARLDEGRPLEREPVELATVAAEAIDAARVLDATRPLRSELEPAWVVGDHDRLRQAIDNLLSNVRAHTPPETRIAIAVRPVAGMAEIRVSDTGPGLDPDDAARVFRRFYRTDGSRTRASGGVGLGLSIVDAVVRAHGGRAVAEPTPGGGATFVLSIPLAVLAERAMAEPVDDARTS